jgi:hypothetical protein
VIFTIKNKMFPKIFVTYRIFPPSPNFPQFIPPLSFPSSASHYFIHIFLPRVFIAVAAFPFAHFRHKNERRIGEETQKGWMNE